MLFVYLIEVKAVLSSIILFCIIYWFLLFMITLSTNVSDPGILH